MRGASAAVKTRLRGGAHEGFRERDAQINFLGGLFDAEQEEAAETGDIMVGGVRVGLLLIHADAVAVAEVVVVAAAGVDEDEVVGGGGVGGGEFLEVGCGLGGGVGEAEFVEEAELLGEEEIGVGGVVFGEGEVGGAEAGAEEGGGEDGVGVALGEHGLYPLESAALISAGRVAC